MESHCDISISLCCSMLNLQRLNPCEMFQTFSDSLVDFRDDQNTIQVKLSFQGVSMERMLLASENGLLARICAAPNPNVGVMTRVLHHVRWLTISSQIDVVRCLENQNKCQLFAG